MVYNINILINTFHAGHLNSRHCIRTYKELTGMFDILTAVYPVSSHIPYCRLSNEKKTNRQ